MIAAHRFVWELTNGPIPDGYCICHRCDNPNCVRPEHLFLGTVVDNNRDRHAKGRYGIRLRRRKLRRTPVSLWDRFWSKVEKGPECWEWKAGASSHGYGGFKVAGQLLRAHRVAWELTYGPIPEGMVVCHRCDNPSCVRPDHLFIGTVADNNRDRSAKGRSAYGERNGSTKYWEKQWQLRGGKPAKPEYDPRGEANPNAKLTWLQVRRMRALYAQGKYKQTELATIFGVNKAEVCLIVHGKIWWEAQD
jgi:hypothetical protein